MTHCNVIFGYLCFREICCLHC